MNREVAKAQAETLLDWAMQWSRTAKPGDGSAEVAFLLRRTARLMGKAVGIEMTIDIDPGSDPAPLAEGETAPPAAHACDEARAG